ncbi:alternative ribosome-rescue factor [Izhakiella capsodis]|uniref:Alternative ribosome-rescue factor n=1 Tax=Izhakiella capsodis TaxID=1367852 RepID=A0A1I5BHF8_9GAMM|nr:alternative ribosome rescue factor ArfA [Izhakiella capsodis]SFN74174.1 alternative ribosome-rescue factor [Izhakiella capsodis]
MADFRYKRGKIRNNALKALLQVPLFRQRVEVNLRGKPSYRSKEKNCRSMNWESIGKMSIYQCPLA